MTVQLLFDETALSAYTDAELEQYINECASVKTTREEVVRRLSPHLVAKPVAWPEDPQDEVIALERARAVGVNVPSVRRVVPCDDDNHFIIMDYIDGSMWTPALEAWPGAWDDDAAIAGQLGEALSCCIVGPDLRGC